MNGGSGVHALARPALGAAATIKAVAVAAVATGVSKTAVGLTDLGLVPPHPSLEFWILLAVAVLAEVRPFMAPGAARRMTAVHLSLCFTFAIMLLWGPVPAVVVQSIAIMTAEFRQRLGWSRAALTASRMALALFAADAVFSRVGPPTLGLGDRLTESDVIAVLVAAGAWFVVNYVLVTLEIRMRFRAPWRQVFTRTLAHELLSTGALLLLAPFLISAPTGWVFALVLVPVIAVSQMARLSDEQEALVRLDPLSGLLSRRALAAEITELIADARRHRGHEAENQFALMIIDLDRFKNVNDALGHAVGDQLLTEVARRLADLVRPGDIVSRLGGDEFAVVAVRMPNIAQAQAIAARIGKQLREPIYLDGLPLDASASIGVAMYPVDGEDVITLMRHADVAMYAAKRHNAEVAVYSPGTDNNSADRLGLLADLRVALDDADHAGEIRLVYQPQVAIETGEVVGVEALLRWHHPVRGSVSPTEIVRTAENSAVMLQLTFLVIDQTLAQVAAWRSAGHELRASINVSVRDLHSSDIVEHLRLGLLREHIGAGDIEIEITETAVMADPERVSTTVHQLADLGVGLSLDDFGTGYSSLLHLRELPLQEVKIDQSFVRSMAESPTDRAIVRSIIELSHALGLRVVAEGVEDGHIASLLAAAECDIAQGWHYGAPMSPDALVTWLAKRSEDRPGPSEP